MDQTTTAEYQSLIPMQIVREYCRLGHKLRQLHKIPVAYPLYEMRINVLELDYATVHGLTLLAAERELIADELNVDFVEPVITGNWSKYAEVVSLTEGQYTVWLDICKDHFLDRRYMEAQAHRAEMEQRKAAGLKQLA